MEQVRYAKKKRTRNSRRKRLGAGWVLEGTGQSTNLRLKQFIDLIKFKILTMFLVLNLAYYNMTIEIG